MKIAQVAPLFESVPPSRYGGTERIVSYLTEELINQGHEVTLFASGDSLTRAQLISPCSQALWLGKKLKDEGAPHTLLLEQVFSRADQFDVIHSHIDHLSFPLSRRQKTPVLTTLHGRLDLPEFQPLYAEFNDVPVVSISNAQRAPLPDLNWFGTVYHGLPIDLLPFEPTPEPYLAFLGRFSPEKGADLAIRIARKAGQTLMLAAKIDDTELAYYHEVLLPLLKLPGIHPVGEVSDLQKKRFLGKAKALLFPINWPEPFGLVLIEAMACGTPVIAYGRGSVPELIEDGITGFIVDSEEEAVRAIKRLPSLSRKLVRKRFEELFSSQRMARDYLLLYEKLTNPLWKKSSDLKISFTS
jgi:glycosyltransferase involved in cell wall biosynthesis